MAVMPTGAGRLGPTLLGALLALLVLAPGPGQAQTGRRVALVIGNEAYRTAPRLSGPARDAGRVGEMLRSLGFADVRIARDLDGAEFGRELEAFRARSAGADWALVFYAGRSLQVGGMTYLMPIDAKVDVDILSTALDLDRVLVSAGQAKALRLVLVDGSRDNPFKASRPPGSPTGGTDSAAGPDTLIVFSTAPGRTAETGRDGKGSPFVEALIKTLPSPGLELNAAFRRVRDEVMAATDGRQSPFAFGALSAEPMYFVSPRR